MRLKIKVKMIKFYQSFCGEINDEFIFVVDL